jgi:hypothetical protein
MPLSINVGLSRKASKDYQSTGVSINVTAELDQALLAKPDELQQQVGDLYAQAQHALDRQAAGMAEPDRRRNGNDDQRVSRPNGRHGRDGYSDRGYNNGSRGGQHRNGGGDGAMTQSQRRAILAIAQRADLDVDYECREVIGSALDDLTLRQASELIDHLKGLQPAANGRNANGR